MPAAAATAPKPIRRPIAATARSIATHLGPLDFDRAVAAWAPAERRALLSVMHAKGNRSEMAYARLLDGHGRLRRSLEALALD